MDINELFRTETPIEALKKNGIELAEMTERGLIFNCNVWHCEFCGENNAYEIPINFSMVSRTTKNTTLKSHYFCSKECEAAWVVKLTHIPLSFRERIWNITGEKILNLLGTSSWALKDWWEWNISRTAPELLAIFQGRNELIDLLRRGSNEAISDFYLRYIDTSILSQKLAKKFPRGLWMISLTKDAPTPKNPYSIGARFLIEQPNIIYFSNGQRKTMRIDPHPDLKIKRKIELIGSEVPGSIDQMILVEFPSKNPRLEIHIPISKTVIVHIGIKKYIDFDNNKFVPISKIYDEEYLEKDQNGIPYLPYRLNYKWRPDESCEDSFEKQFEDFVSAARNFAELHGIREYNELLTNGNFSLETLADIGLFMEDWRQWRKKHTKVKIHYGIK
jgi:hypothetical protein